jgi:2-dehydro-3-deoxy-D-arabinonate dehydratase
MDASRLFRTNRGLVATTEGEYRFLKGVHLDKLFTSTDPLSRLIELTEDAELLENFSPTEGPFLAPIGSQEVWAAGVTYYRSRDARMKESKEAGGGAFYDRVYMAERPELFFKATPHRVVGHRQKIRIRSDSGWSVPEPELTLAVSSHGKVFGCTIGNDVSARDIEGENPLYLPQAKVYDGCCALGPCLWIGDPLSVRTQIHLEILRGEEALFRGSTSLSELKRSPQGLIDYLFRDNSFPKGCFLMTGTGIVPPDSVTLCPGDEVRIEIEPIGTLINSVS